MGRRRDRGSIPGPGVTVGAELHFAHGAFNGGNFRTAEFPGILVFHDVWLNEIRIGFQLDPVMRPGGVTFGFQPIAPPDTYAIGVRGAFRIETGPPVVVQISGSGSVFGIDIAHAFFRYSSDGTLPDPRGRHDRRSAENASALSGALKFGIIGKAFGGSIEAEGVCVRSAAPRARGRGQPARPGGLPRFPGQHLPRLGRLGRQHRYPCPRPASPTTTRSSRGHERRPARRRWRTRADLHGPGGSRLPTPSPSPATAARPRVALRDPAGQTDRIRRPQGPSHSRQWQRPWNPGVAHDVCRAGPPEGRDLHPRARPPARPPSPDCGSPAATPPPRSPRRSAGSGRKRTLRYRVSGNAPRTSIVFVERGPAGDVPIGTAKGAAGILRFTSGNGPGGRRAILAEATRGGLAFTAPEVAHYTAPAIPRPGAVGHLLARRARVALSVCASTAHPGAKTDTREGPAVRRSRPAAHA